AIPCTWGWIAFMHKLQPLWHGATVAPESESAPRATPPLSQQGSWSRNQLYAMAALLFVAIWVLFYSSFFTNFPQGIYDWVRTFGYWLKTSKSAHEYGVFKYLEWLWQMEKPALILGAAGIVVTLRLAHSRFAVFTAFWSLGILAAYSLVGYKTPWCAL